MKIPASATRDQWAGWRRWCFPVLALLALAGCGSVQPLRESFRATTPHERYAESLREAGLEGTALGRDWNAAAERALDAPNSAPLPFREAGYFPAEEPHAVGYRFRAVRGQRFTAQVELEGAAPPRVFLDLFEVPQDTARPPTHVMSADTTSLTLTWEPRQDTEYLLRLQPELLRAGRYAVTIRSQAALAFPIDGRDSRAIGSRFGAERDGGRREHHGVDIFAPRGTPVLASAAGTVTRVDETPRGGRVVWVRDSERGLSLYYAHLDSQAVQPGARVQPGDTLGTVGNTGNARTTPPHLHFGIYRRGEGPLDPYPYVHPVRSPLPPPAADTAGLGRWARVAARETPLLSQPAQGTATARVLPRHTLLRPMGTSGSWHRVLLPDGTSGYVAIRSVEPVSRPIRRTTVATGVALRDGPMPAAAMIDTLRAGTSVTVLARFADFLLVEGTGGRQGWITE